MSREIGPEMQTALLLRAVGTMLPALLIALGLITAYMGQRQDLYVIGWLLLACGLGWLVYGLLRLVRATADRHEEDWPADRL